MLEAERSGTAQLCNLDILQLLYQMEIVMETVSSPDKETWLERLLTAVLAGFLDDRKEPDAHED